MRHLFQDYLLWCTRFTNVTNVGDNCIDATWRLSSETSAKVFNSSFLMLHVSESLLGEGSVHVSFLTHDGADVGVSCSVILNFLAQLRGMVS